MARAARIIGQTTDLHGHRYDVREERGGPVPILIGWPEGFRGPGCGGPKVILTVDLAAYM